MIQRIQTVYLVLALVVLSFLFLAPICSYADAEGTSFALSIKDMVGSDGSVVGAKSNVTLLILSPIAALAVIFMIVQFKNRQKQLSAGRLIYFLLGTIIILAWFFIEANKYEGMEITGYGLGYFAPVAALPFIFLANRAIKKDEELVKSLDRLR